MSQSTSKKFYLIYTIVLAVLNGISSILFEYKLFFVPFLISIIAILIIYFMLIKQENKEHGNVTKQGFTIGTLILFAFLYEVFYIVAYIMLKNNANFIYLNFTPWSNLLSILTIGFAAGRFLIKK